MTSSFFANLLILLIVGTCLVHVLGAVKRKRFFVFDPLIFFWVGVIVIYVLEGISNYDFYVTYYGESVVLDVLLWIWVGIIFLQLGYRLKWGSKLADRLPVPPRRLRPDRFLAFSLSLIAIGLVGWWLQIMTAGSVAAWGAVARGGENWEELSGYVTLMAGLLTIGVSLFVLHVELHRRSPALRLLAWSMLALQLLFFLYLGSRSRTISIVLIALMAWSLPRRKNPSILLMSTLFVGLFLVTSFQAEYRGHFKNFSFNLDEISWDEVPSKILPKFITGYQSLKSVSLGSEFGLTSAVVQLVPDRIPYAYGYEFLQIITNVIPRSLFPEKPYPRGESWSEIHMVAGTSSWWVEHVHKPFIAGPSPGYIASWYYNGGVVGLILGGMATGVFLRLIRGIYDRSKNNESFLIIYLVMVPIGFGEATGHPFSWVYSLPIIFVPLIFIIKFSGVKNSTREN